MEFILIGVGFVLLLWILLTPVRNRKNAKNKAVLAEAGAKLEDVPKRKNDFIDENYNLFLTAPSGVMKIDVKQVKNMEILSQRIQGNRTYYLVFKDASGSKIGSIFFPSQKQAESLQEFVQKYVDKIAAGN